MQTNNNRNTTSGAAQNAAGDNELTTVPTEILADWVTDRGRCAWESTLVGPFQWTGYTATDRPIAARMCAGCPVRAECLELETRNAQDDDQVRDAVHPSDMAVLLDLWAVRDRADLAATLDAEEAGR